MAEPDDPQVRLRVREEEDVSVAEYLRLAVRLLLLAMPIYVVLDHYLAQSHIVALHALKLVVAIVCLALSWALRQPAYRSYYRGLGLMLVTVVCNISAISSSLTGDVVSHPLFVLV